MKLVTFWHLLSGLNMGLFVFSWSLQDTNLMMLNSLSAFACLVAAYATQKREEAEEKVE